LRFLHVSNCRLKSLAGIAHSTSLKHLIACDCENLREIPDELSSFNHLEEVDVRDSGIRTLPSGYKMLAGRGILKVSGCGGLVEFLVKDLQAEVGNGDSHDCVSTVSGGGIDNRPLNDYDLGLATALSCENVYFSFQESSNNRE
jgi:Leucine-rich repeat (LRR) protein